MDFGRSRLAFTFFVFSLLAEVVFLFSIVLFTFSVVFTFSGVTNIRSGFLSAANTDAGTIHKRNTQSHHPDTGPTGPGFILLLLSV